MQFPSVMADERVCVKKCARGTEHGLMNTSVEATVLANNFQSRSDPSLTLVHLCIARNGRRNREKGRAKSMSPAILLVVAPPGASHEWWRAGRTWREHDHAVQLESSGFNSLFLRCLFLDPDSRRAASFRCGAHYCTKIGTGMPRAIPLAALALSTLADVSASTVPLSGRGSMDGERIRDGERGYGVETKFSSPSSRVNAKASADASANEKEDQSGEIKPRSESIELASGVSS
ncbi:hypothetical protein EDB87DRAFT_1823278 [Lactarius vividus]|nr:hypothetical protein EDB87DRAFT_1823278 [Lactarius vividus]